MVKFILGLVAIAIVGGGVFLLTWDIPAPSADVERDIDKATIVQ